MASHLRHLWVECWRIETSTGDEAYALEKGIHVWWREELRQPPFYERSPMPQLGATETVAWEVAPPIAVLAKALELVELWNFRVGTPSIALYG